ncbi:MAG: HD domain-containing protein [Candidatus Aenigmarchaeota archaeon]|nr:HD domain-containing protein [Candidatus Aenigmarchaeota archaeon]
MVASIGKFLEQERNLGKVIRFSARARLKDESVAEHSFHVAFYSMLLADLEMSYGNKVDVERLLRSALLHDLEECLTGDIMHSFKYSDAKVSKEIKRISGKFFDGLIASLPNGLPKKYSGLWAGAKSPSIEGRILQAADRLEALLYSMQEYSMGNSHFKHTAEEITAKLKGTGLKSVETVLKGLNIGKK